LTVAVAWIGYSVCQGFETECKWIPLQEDLAINALTDDETPGSILMRIGLGSPKEAEKDGWEEDLAGIDARCFSLAASRALCTDDDV